MRARRAHRWATLAPWLRGAAVPLQRPLDVLAHQRRSVAAARLERLQHGGGGWRVAERDPDVARPALVADAMDRRTLHARAELRRRPAKELHEIRAIKPMADLEVRIRRGARELVPRAHQLAVIAAVDAVAEEGAQLHWDRALVLDGKVGDAAARVQAVRCDDRAGGTGRDTRTAAAAVLTRALIRRQRHVGEDLP